MMRLFVAVEITDSGVINSIREFQENISIDARGVKLKNLHFTLQFLGEISGDITQKIIQSLQMIEFSSFKINLRGVGAFPKPESPRVVWIGTDKDGGDMLVELSRKVEKVLEPLGFFPDKPFKPHITVFRIKKKIGDITGELENYKTINFGIQGMSKIKLKKSELTPDGPVYSDLAEVDAKK